MPILEDGSSGFGAMSSSVPVTDPDGNLMLFNGFTLRPGRRIAASSGVYYEADTHFAEARYDAWLSGSGCVSQ
ncbi:MAG: hypothetical protein ACE5FT_06050 [Candidatus Nanoarchaeia archaeon]